MELCFYNTWKIFNNILNVIIIIIIIIMRYKNKIRELFLAIKLPRLIQFLRLRVIQVEYK